MDAYGEPAAVASSSNNPAATQQCRSLSTRSNNRSSRSRSPTSATVTANHRPPRYNFPRHVRHSRHLSGHVDLIVADQAADVLASMRRLQKLVVASPAHHSLRETANLAHEPTLYPAHVWERILDRQALLLDAPSSPLAMAALDVNVDQAIQYSRTIEKLRLQLLELHRLRQPGSQNHLHDPCAADKSLPPSPARLSCHFSPTQ